MTVVMCSPSLRILLGLGEGVVGSKFHSAGLGLEHVCTPDELRAVVRSGTPVTRTVDTLTGPVGLTVRRCGGDSGGVEVAVAGIRERAHAHRLARQVLDALPAQVAVLDRAGRIRVVNREWELFAEANGANQSWVGTDYLACCGTSPRAREVADGIRRVLNREAASYDFEYPCHSPHESRWFLMRCSPTGESSAVVVHFDITPQKKVEQDLAGLAYRDHLTGVCNRRGFERELALEQSRVDRNGSSLCAVPFDCDNFKRINDTLGMVMGDAVIVAVARRLEGGVRPGDTVSRIGGDEFVVLLPDVRQAEAGLIAERLRLAVSAHPVVSSHTSVTMTVSAAVVPLDREVLTLEALLDRGRTALKSSKSNGKNRTSLAAHPDVPPDDSCPRQDLVGLLTGCRLGVTYQPIVEMASGAVVGYELRSKIVDRPNVSPQTLLLLAQEEGILPVVDQRFLSACMAGGRRLDPRVRRHVNLYPSTLLSMTETAVHDLTREPGLDRCCFELSEQQLVGDPTLLLPTLRAFRAAGARLAIDDVGFGRTAVDTLVVLEPEVAKIDRKLVFGLANDPGRQRWLKRLLRLAMSLGIDLVATGIESEEDAEAVRRLGIPYGQGYHFGRPGECVPTPAA